MTNLTMSEFVEQQQSQAANTASNRPEAKVWLNVGVSIGGQFISLPYGLALDTMQPMKGNSALAAQSNGLLEHILKLAEDLEPGQTAPIDLQLQVRKVGGEKPTTEIDFSNVKFG